MHDWPPLCAPCVFADYIEDEEVSAGEVAQLIWAFGEAKVNVPGLIEKSAVALEQNLSELTPEQLCDAAYALACKAAEGENACITVASLLHHSTSSGTPSQPAG